MPLAVKRLLVSHALAAVAMLLPWPLLLVLGWERFGGSGRGELLLGLTGADAPVRRAVVGHRDAGGPVPS